MPEHRRITALLAALTTMAGGSFVTSAAADTDTDSGERGARTALQSAPHDHATAHQRHAQDLAGALGVTDDRLATVLRELRAERRASDVTGARPAVRTPTELAAERTAYAEALATKVGVAPAVAVAALDGKAPRPAPAVVVAALDEKAPRPAPAVAVAALDGTAARPATPAPAPVRPPAPPGTYPG